MKFEKAIPVEEIAQKIGAKIIGDKTLMATGINEIHQVEAGDITFVDVEKYFSKSLKSAATIIILNKKTKCPKGKALLLCEEPFDSYNQLILEQRPVDPLRDSISPTAEIHPTAILEPNVVVGHHVKIGEYTHIQANVVIAEHCTIGKHVNIQSGCIIGTDAFYFKRTSQGYQKWRSGGRVIIEDHVDIGAACTINKGVSGDTVIGEGSKLDCQIHIGHDVKVGKRCLIAGQVGIGGNTELGNEVILYGQVGIVNNLKIGANAIVLAGAGVTKDLETGKTYFGSPAAETRTKFRELAALRHLPEFFAKYYE
ncbi:MAG: UDP-3-O-(3-hydroxymyristoyl)glucosamine N-acyltransferase [Saprospiraceae bacterium]|nr:MAG: UDP-3-O-(3-hydroxymyristoyl)glucosamine N-acyltransferase [Saprospiraceae bacterium]